MLAKQIKRIARTVEDHLADFAGPLVFALSNAPTSLLNAITALMPALVVLLVFHSGLICAGIVRAIVHSSVSF